MNVNTLGFGKSGRRQADDIRLALFANRLESGDDIIVSIHNRGDLIHRCRLQWNRLTKMAYEKHLAKCRAALRAMQHRQAVAQTEKGQCRANRLAGLERADGKRLCPPNDFSHERLPSSVVQTVSPWRPPTVPVCVRPTKPGSRSSARVAAPFPPYRRNRHRHARVPG